MGAAVLAAGLAVAAAAPVSGTPAAAAPQDAIAAKARLDRAAATRPASVTGWHVDPASKSLVVSVHRSADGVAEWAADHGARTVTVEHVAEAPRPVWNLISGQGIYSGSIRCTLGFNARSSSGVRFVLAAGHCVSPGTAWYGVGGYIGPAASSSFPANDYGLIRVTSEAAMSTSLIDRHSSGGDIPISGVATPYVGMSVCSSSPVSGWRCGTITGVNHTVCYPQGCVYQLARSNICADPGGSGAPVVTNPASGIPVRAVGLISGGSGNCSSGGTTYVQPISEPLAAYGLTLWQ